MCELDGPIPILNRSNTLIAIVPGGAALSSAKLGWLVHLRTFSPSGSYGGRSDTLAPHTWPPTLTWYRPDLM